MAKWIRNPKYVALLCIIPMEFLIWFIAMFPFALEIYLSLTDWTPVTGNWWDASFIGAQNYVAMIFDMRFIYSVLRTIGVVGVCVMAEFLIGLILALLFVEEFFGKKVLISIAILPMMFVPAVTGYIFYLGFLSKGTFNLLLEFIFGMPFETSWLTNPTTAFVSIIIADVWQWTPFMFLVLLSGLLALPPDPINAARVLGGSRWRIFRDIELPMLKPVILIAIILRGIESFKMFDTIYIMTGGGPGYATQTLSVYLYEEGFKYLRMAYVSAEGLAILLLVAIVSWFATKPILRRVV